MKVFLFFAFFIFLLPHVDAKSLSISNLGQQFSSLYYSDPSSEVGNYSVDKEHIKKIMQNMENLSRSAHQRKEYFEFLCTDAMMLLDKIFNETVTNQSYKQLINELQPLKEKVIQDLYHFILDYSSASATRRLQTKEQAITALLHFLQDHGDSIAKAANETITKIYLFDPRDQKQLNHYLAALLSSEDLELRVLVNEILKRHRSPLARPTSKSADLAADVANDWPTTNPHFHHSDHWRYLLHSVDWHSKHLDNNFTDKEQDDSIDAFIKRPAISLTYNDQDHQGIYSDSGFIMSVPRLNILVADTKDLFSNYYKVFSKNKQYLTNGQEFLEKSYQDGFFKGLLNSVCANPYNSTWGEVVVYGTHPINQEKIAIIGVFVTVDEDGNAYNEENASLAEQFALRKKVPLVKITTTYPPPNHELAQRIGSLVKFVGDVF
ncbi:MAG: hypothetical protein HQK50_19235 [Oligoflexia bacterium]|nr:hypothetical protein [Oligoflexia bacterium]MBF0367712.1 hypothetical protein [Oligoflexia bacterium]